MENSLVVNPLAEVAALMGKIYDGILDTEEGFGDIDKDGKPNHQDLDSDGDSCFDVTEAGFTDDDSDGTVSYTHLTLPTKA